MNKKLTGKRQLRTYRFGGVAVEFAMVAPIFFLVLLGGIEFASIHVTQCAMENAAFEGARKGIVLGAKPEQCRAAAEEILKVSRVQVYTIQVEPASFDSTTDEVSVTISVPMTPENKFGLAAFLRGGSLVKTISLPRE